MSGISESGGDIKMTGREEKAANDIFFVCSLIDYISRKTLNTRRDVVDALGRKGIEKMY